MRFLLLLAIILLAQLDLNAQKFTKRPLGVRVYEDNAADSLNNQKQLTNIKIYFIIDNDTLTPLRYDRKKYFFFKPYLKTGILVVEADGYKKHEERVLLKHTKSIEIITVRLKVDKGVRLKEVK